MRSLGRKHWAALRESAGDVAARAREAQLCSMGSGAPVESRRGGVGLGSGYGGDGVW